MYLFSYFKKHSGAAPGLSEDGCPSQKIQGFILIFPKRKLGCIQNKENFDIFSEIHPKLGLLAPKFFLRTGAWHPLSKFSGCPGTRGTRTAAAPVYHS